MILFFYVFKKYKQLLGFQTFNLFQLEWRAIKFVEKNTFCDNDSVLCFPVKGGSFNISMGDKLLLDYTDQVTCSNF